MGAAKASNSKDTYLATAVTFIVIGAKKEDSPVPFPV